MVLYLFPNTYVFTQDCLSPQSESESTELAMFTLNQYLNITNESAPSQIPDIKTKILDSMLIPEMNFMDYSNDDNDLEEFQFDDDEVEQSLDTQYSFIITKKEISYYLHIFELNKSDRETPIINTIISNFPYPLNHLDFKMLRHFLQGQILPVSLFRTISNYNRLNKTNILPEINMNLLNKTIEEIKFSLNLHRGMRATQTLIDEKNQQIQKIFIPGIETFDMVSFFNHNPVAKELIADNRKDIPNSVIINEGEIALINIKEAPADIVVFARTNSLNAIAILPVSINDKEYIIAMHIPSGMKGHLDYFTDNIYEWIKSEKGNITGKVRLISPYEIKESIETFQYDFFYSLQNQSVAITKDGYTFVDSNSGKKVLNKFKEEKVSEDENSSAFPPTEQKFTELTGKAVQNILNEYAMQGGAFKFSTSDLNTIISKLKNSNLYNTLRNEFGAEKIFQNEQHFYDDSFDLNNRKEYYKLWEMTLSIFLSPVVMETINPNIKDISDDGTLIRSYYWGLSAFSRIKQGNPGVLLPAFVGKNFFSKKISRIKESDSLTYKSLTFVDEMLHKLYENSKRWDGINDHDTYHRVKHYFGDYSRFPFIVLQNYLNLTSLLFDPSHISPVIESNILKGNFDGVVAAEYLYYSSGDNERFRSRLGVLEKAVELDECNFEEMIEIALKSKGASKAIFQFLADINFPGVELKKEDFDFNNPKSLISRLIRLADNNKGHAQELINLLVKPCNDHKLTPLQTLELAENAGEGAVGLLREAIDFFSYIEGKPNYPTFFQFLSYPLAPIAKAAGYDGSIALFRKNHIRALEKQFGLFSFIPLAQALGEDFVYLVNDSFMPWDKFLNNQDAFDINKDGTFFNSLVKLHNRAGLNSENIFKNALSWIYIFGFVKDANELNPDIKGSFGHTILLFADRLKDHCELVFDKIVRKRDDIQSKIIMASSAASKYIHSSSDLNPDNPDSFAYAIIQSINVLLSSDISNRNPEKEKILQQLFDAFSGNEVIISKYGFTPLLNLIKKWKKDFGLGIMQTILPEASKFIENEQYLIFDNREIVYVNEPEWNDTFLDKLINLYADFSSLQATKVLNFIATISPLINSKNDWNHKLKESTMYYFYKLAERCVDIYDRCNKEKGFQPEKFVIFEGLYNLKHLLTDKKELDPDNEDSVVSILLKIPFFRESNSIRNKIFKELLEFCKTKEELKQFVENLKYWEAHTANLRGSIKESVGNY